MDQLFDPDTSPAGSEWEPGTVFERAALAITRLEMGHRRGGSKAWTDVYAALRANADHYRSRGFTHLAEKLDVLAARARGVVERHSHHGPPLPNTLRHPLDVLT